MKTIYLKGDIGFEITAEKIRGMIDIKSTEKLQVIVNSPGGFVFEAFEIYNIFEQYKGQIEFVIMPFAASAASYMVMAGKNSKIRAFKNSTWMAHRVSSIAFGDADDLLREANIMQALENIIIEAYQKRIKMDKPSMMAMLKSEMWLIGWEQLTESGIIDDVIDSIDEVELPDEEKEEIKKIEKESNSDLHGSINLLKMKIAKTQTRMKNENEKVKNMYERIAAKFEINLANKKPVENNIQEVNKMKLADLLKANPEAQAEYDNDLKTAREQERITMTSEKVADRSRIASILKAANIQLSEDAKEAIVNDVAPGDFALAEIERQRNLLDKVSSKESPFNALVSKQTPAEQAKNAIEAEKLSDAEKLKAFDENAGKAISSIIPKKKGDK
jgi:ATP-dependent Clp protease protease subunit